MTFYKATVILYAKDQQPITLNELVTYTGDRRIHVTFLSITPWVELTTKGEEDE